MSEDCPYCVFEKTEANCPGCFEGSHYRPKPITNADRIRAMSDEKLAEWLGDMLGVYPFGTEQWDRQAWLDWLKKEVKE